MQLTERRLPSRLTPCGVQKPCAGQDFGRTIQCLGFANGSHRSSEHGKPAASRRSGCIVPAESIFWKGDKSVPLTHFFSVFKNA